MVPSSPFLRAPMSKSAALYAGPLLVVVILR
jgi:hypothetical protein